MIQWVKALTWRPNFDPEPMAEGEYLFLKAFCLPLQLCYGKWISEFSLSFSYKHTNNNIIIITIIIIKQNK